MLGVWYPRIARRLPTQRQQQTRRAQVAATLLSMNSCSPSNRYGGSCGSGGRRSCRLPLFMRISPSSSTGGTARPSLDCSRTVTRPEQIAGMPFAVHRRHRDRRHLIASATGLNTIVRFDQGRLRAAHWFLRDPYFPLRWH